MAKILMLITNFGNGGAQRVFFDHSVSLSARNVVEEAVFNSDEDIRIYNSGQQLHSLDATGRLWPGPIGRIIARAKSLKRVVRDGKFDAVISHMDGANWINILSRSAAKKILVVHGTILHDYDQRPWVQWLRKKVIIPYLYNRAAVTVAVSEGIAHELKTICRVQKVISIPNFFETKRIKDRADEPLSAEFASLFDNYDVLVTSGRLAEQKKQETLFDILLEVRKSFPRVKLMLLGDGNLRQGLLEKAKRMGFKVFSAWDADVKYSDDFDVYFMGYVENPYKYLRRSRLFLFVSGWEGFPMALCEAMISGVPVLSADCPTGPREILAPATTIDVSYSLQTAEFTEVGVLLPMFDKASFKSEWVKAINALLADPARTTSMADNAAQAISKYDKEIVFARWQALIDSVTK